MQSVPTWMQVIAGKTALLAMHPQVLYHRRFAQWVPITSMETEIARHAPRAAPHPATLQRIMTRRQTAMYVRRDTATLALLATIARYVPQARAGAALQRPLATCVRAGIM